MEENDEEGEEEYEAVEQNKEAVTDNKNTYSNTQVYKKYNEQEKIN